MNVIITRQIPETGIELLRQTCDVTVWPNELPPSREELKQLVRGADGIICLLSDKIDAEIMDAAGPQLKVISNYAVGVDNINLADASARQIRVGNTPGILTNATADMAFSLLLAAARSVSQGDRYVRDAKWKTWGPKLFLGYELTQKTLGIVGFGRIGKAFAKRALGWDMRVLFYSPSYPKEEVPELNACKVDLDTLLRESDFISLHCPLNDRSRGMINAE
ncbi:MAG: D-glycerate dehydrogenase, partial [Anaerolineaceae bacterium]|nr:D-glycerate dehydrogenase [Anaerolineaceae bacterium]